MAAVNIFYRSLGIVASDLQCKLIPVHHYWAGYLEENGFKNSDLTLSDSRYPNEKGHEVIAEVVMNSLQGIFEGREQHSWCRIENCDVPVSQYCKSHFGVLVGDIRFQVVLHRASRQLLA
jgi:hypothetical protein